MSDLISRKAAIDAIPEYRAGFALYTNVREVKRRLEALPSAEPQERKGKWINISDTCNECSECGATWSYLLDEILRFRYCPNCGARMEVEHD